MTTRADSPRPPRRDTQLYSHALRRHENSTILNEAFLRAGHLSFIVATSKAFDYRAFHAILHSTPGVELVTCVNDLELAAGLCGKLRPDAVILDVSYPDGKAFEVGRQLLSEGRVRVALFFDWQFAFWRALKALQCGPDARYFTREFDLQDLCRRVRLGVDVDDRSFVSSQTELQKLDSYKLLSLSPKELLVMQWLANDHSIRGVAEKLGLAESTVDNHKSRIMSKLNVNKMTALVRIALESGLLD